MTATLDDLYYDGNDLGLVYGAQASGFKVWAPTAAAVFVALYDDAGTYNDSGIVVNHVTDNLHLMQRDAKTGVWAAAITGNLEGKYYLFRVEFADGTASWAADPYAKAVSANGQRMAIIDMAKTSPPGWRPEHKPPFRAGAWQDAVICELHVRDFSIDENSGMRHRGKYLAFTERGTVTPDGVSTGVDHLVKLGITHVHLLPVFDFVTVNELVVDSPASALPKYNWGYDPMNYNVPEGSYSTDPTNPAKRIVEFKAMVQALHDAGIRVVMDVVFNHTYATGGWPFDAVVPGYYYRMTRDGRYADGSACGNEVASERPMVRKFIVDSCRHWVNEYNIDGFRFDLMGLIDVPTMKTIAGELRRIDPTLIIYGEPWHAGGSVLEESLQTVIGAQKGLGFAIFNDRIRTSIKGGSDDNSRGFATGEPSREKGIVTGVMGSIDDFTEEANESVNYVTAHDNLNLWDKTAYSLGARRKTPGEFFAGVFCNGNFRPGPKNRRRRGFSLAEFAESPYAPPEGPEGKKNCFDSFAVKSSILANGIVFTSQGIPFFQAGDEFLRTKFGDRNSYKSTDDVNKIRWENAGLYREVADYYAGLIRLRREHPAFRQTRGEDIKNTLEVLSAKDMGVSFLLKNNANGDPWHTIFVAYNAGRSAKTFTLPAGVSVWQQVVDSRRAGTETLCEVFGSVILPPVSMAVLHGQHG